MNAYAVGQLSFFVFIAVIGIAVVWIVMRSRSVWAKLTGSFGVLVLVAILFLGSLPGLLENNFEREKEAFAAGVRDTCGAETVASLYPELTSEDLSELKIDDLCDCVADVWSAGYSRELGEDLDAGNGSSELILEVVQKTYEQCPVEDF